MCIRDSYKSTGPGNPIDVFPSIGFLSDLQSGEVREISRDLVNVFPRGGQFRFSGDGDNIVFTSSQNDLVAEDNNGAIDAFIYNIPSQAYTSLSQFADRSSSSPASNVDGTVTVFETASTNLTSEANNNGFSDIYSAGAGVALTAPVCDGVSPGLLGSENGASIRLLGTDRCLVSSMVTYGQISLEGLVIPATVGRPALQLRPSLSSFGNGELVFFSYPRSEGDALLVTDFIDDATGYQVRLSFLSRQFDELQLLELVVLPNATADRNQALYLEQDTLWTFTPQATNSQVTITASNFLDSNENGVRDDGEPIRTGRTVTLFRCGSSDGLVATQRTNLSGFITFPGLEPGEYQLSFSAFPQDRFVFEFDSNGNLQTPILLSTTGADGNPRGITGCLNFDAGANAEIAVGFQP